MRTWDFALKAKLSSTLAGGSDASLNVAYTWAAAPLLGGKLGVVSDLGLAGAKSGKVTTSAGWAPSSSLLLGAEGTIASKWDYRLDLSHSFSRTTTDLLDGYANTIRDYDSAVQSDLTALRSQ